MWPKWLAVGIQTHSQVKSEGVEAKQKEPKGSGPERGAAHTRERNGGRARRGGIWDLT